MPTYIPVKFKFAAHELWFNPADSGAQEGDHVICTTERGQEIGLACFDAREVSEERLHEVIGESNLALVDRIATEEDLKRAEKLAEKGEAALPIFRRLAHESELDMKPVGVEYLFGGNKVVCYFSADDRVDFRQLVRDLSHELHERIDMRQIGVREEAAIVGGYAHCGQELCCARFGTQFEPVSIRMAKEQDLPLNSSKISGACGRLMCCLRYEFEAYRDFKSRAPKRNAVIDTPFGKAKIVEYDTPKEQICLRLENGKQIRVPLADMEASEAACEKSKELGCTCRPDTVTRSALEKLQSPEVQMALAELDRSMGIESTAADFFESDLFIESSPKRRRAQTENEAVDKFSLQSRSTKLKEDEGSSSSMAQTSGESFASTTTPSKKKQAAQARLNQREQSARFEQSSSSGSTRVRRHRKQSVLETEPSSARISADENDTSSTRTVHRRRRHHGASEGADSARAQKAGSRQTARSGAQQVSRNGGQQTARSGAQQTTHAGAQYGVRKSGKQSSYTGPRHGARKNTAKQDGSIDKHGSLAPKPQAKPTRHKRRPGDHGLTTGPSFETRQNRAAPQTRRRRRAGGHGGGAQGGSQGGADA